MLVAWANESGLHSGISFSGGNSKYFTGAPTTARGVLTSTYGWTITDGGSQTPTSFTAVTSGAWNSNTTWGTAAGSIPGINYPGPFDSATIGSGVTVTLSANQKVLGVTVSSGGTLNLAGYQFSATTFNVRWNAWYVHGTS